MMRLVPILLLCLCACAAPASEPRVLVAGDSVLAWNRGSVARELSTLSGADVESRAKSGAWVGFPELGGVFARFGIGAQVPQERFDWVVVNGGANDLATLCDCRACDEVRDRLISEDAREGSLPAMWEAINERTDARVLIVGYYEGIRATRFIGCRDALRTLDLRAALFAERMTWAEFVDAGDVVDNGMLAPDGIHPGPTGSKAIARLVAQTIGGS